jgi:hypothetical protein
MAVLHGNPLTGRWILRRAYQSRGAVSGRPFCIASPHLPHICITAPLNFSNSAQLLWHEI